MANVVTGTADFTPLAMIVTKVRRVTLSVEDQKLKVKHVTRLWIFE